MDSLDSDVIKSGLLRKKGGRVNTWGERYFVLRGHTLYYYVKASDSEPKGVFQLQSSCLVSKISSDVSKKRKQFVFKITWRMDDDGEDKEDGTDGKDAKKSRKKGEKDDKGSLMSGGKVAAVAVGGVVVGALTSGIGLLAGMMVVGMGAAAGGGAVALNQGAEHKEKVLLLASESFHEAENWVNAIETQIQDLGDQALGTVSGSGIHFRSRKHNPRPEVRLDEVEEWISTSKWKVCDVFEGVRLLSLSSDVDDEQRYFGSYFGRNSTSADPQGTAPCMRVNIGVNGSAADTFSGIINFVKSLRTGIVKNIRIVENIDNFNDVIHIKLEPIYIYPTWTAPRDFCVMRYWRDNSDGSYVICLDSTYHPDCPVVDGYVRGELHAAYLVAPPKTKDTTTGGAGAYFSAGKDNEDEESTECLLTFIAQLDPKGWIWKTGGYQHLFLKEFMLQVLDVRDALDSDRFVQVHFDPVCEQKMPTAAGAVVATDNIPQGSIANIPPPVLAPSMWTESDASTFRVRGETYNQNKVKTPSAPALFKLLAIDFFEVPEPTQNISAHPRNRVNMALQRGDDSWVFVVNIMVPGPPFLSFVVYFLADKAKVNADTPFGRIARPFFFGNDDEFRNNRFKLIPKIIDGNMIIKMAVKDTPTLLGNKLKQYYHKGENYFELDVDVGSSSVARNVVGLAIGYSKNIVVDMGFCLQGNEEDELPEVLMGACTCAHVDSTTVKKL